ASTAKPLLAARGIPQPTVLDSRLLVPAGAILLVLGIALLLPAVNVLVRPVFTVAWAGLVLAFSAIAETVLTATQIHGVRPGAGAWLGAAALIAVLVAAACAALAGGIERDEVDLTALGASRWLLVPGLLGVVLAVPGIALPVITAPSYQPADLVEHFHLSSWGLLVALLAVVVGVAVAGFSRPLRGAGLLLGAALVMAIRASEYPLTSARVSGAAVGTGTWFSVAAVLVLLAGALLAVWLARRAVAGGLPG
ncbi:MAG: hypothetical protein ACRDRL_05220, partial [Sciscionella sp.]